MDTILGILSGESYSGIRALLDLSMCVKYTNSDVKVLSIETVNNNIKDQASSCRWTESDGGWTYRLRLRVSEQIMDG